MADPVTFDVADRATGNRVATGISGDELNKLLDAHAAGQYQVARHPDHDCKRDGCNGQTGGA